MPVAPTWTEQSLPRQQILPTFHPCAAQAAGAFVKETIQNQAPPSAGRRLEEVQACRRSVELDSESFLSQMLLQLVLHMDGKLEESVAAGETALSMSGRLAWSMAFLAVTYGKWGKTEQPTRFTRRWWRGHGG